MRRPVVYVSAYFPPDLGGTERVAADLAERMSARRPVTVFTSRPREYHGTQWTFPVQRFRALRVAQVPLMPGLLVALLRIGRDRIVHLHLGQSFVPEVVWLTSVLRRRPYVVHFHLDIAPSTRFGPLFVAYKRLVLPTVLRRAAAVIVLSADQATMVATTYGVDAHRLHIVPNAVGDEFRELRRRETDDGSKLQLLFVGRLSAQKNLFRLLRAMSLATAPVTLDIVGDGRQRDELVALARRLDLGNVTFRGQLEGDALVDAFRRADALVLTSDHEGMPLVLLEAMSAGLPILATDVPGVRSTVGDAALVVAPDDDAIARGIDELASRPELRRELAERGRTRSSAHEWPRVLDTLDAVYAMIEA